MNYVEAFDKCNDLLVENKIDHPVYVDGIEYSIAYMRNNKKPFFVKCKKLRELVDTYFDDCYPFDNDKVFYNGMSKVLEIFEKVEE